MTIECSDAPRSPDAAQHEVMRCWSAVHRGGSRLCGAAP